MTQDPASNKPAPAPGTPSSSLGSSSSGRPRAQPDGAGQPSRDDKRPASKGDKGGDKSGGRDSGRGSGKGADKGKGGAAAAQKDPLRRSRAGGFYVGIIALGIVLVLLIIFIVQNTEPTTVRFLGFEGETPVAVALLIAAAAGLFLAGIAASLRILQLRRRVKHDRKG